MNNISCSVCIYEWSILVETTLIILIILITLGEPIMAEKLGQRVDRENTQDQQKVSELQTVYINQMTQLFEGYKGLAGYPGAELEII